MMPQFIVALLRHTAQVLRGYAGVLLGGWQLVFYSNDTYSCSLPYYPCRS